MKVFSKTRSTTWPIFCILFSASWFTETAVFATQSENNRGMFSGNFSNRIKRSPQLFSGKNVFSDLTSQLKPPSLNDLNEFRQKMANLANLTAILEHAIAAEKTARGTLQNFVNTIKGQIVGVQKAVNPDPENYWAESTICGGILVSQTGKISYKLNDYYNNHERCVWTVRANYRSTIRVTFNTGDLEADHDYVAVTEFINIDTEHKTEWKTKRISPGQTMLFKGPMVLITFVSDGSIRRKGFLLEFEGMGTNIQDTIIFEHFHFSHKMGHFDTGNLTEHLQTSNKSELTDKRLLITFVINPSGYNNTDLHLAFPIDSLNLKPEDCEKTNLEGFASFAVFAHGASQRCCSSECESHDLVSHEGTLLSIFKTSEYSTENNFQLKWFTDTAVKEFESVDECGGILSGNYGKISYKKNSIYENNERCVWLVHADIMKEGETKIQLLKDGFEERYDYLSISFLNDKSILETRFLYKSGSPVRIQSPFVLIQFYSDSATFGKATGFEFIWEIKNTADKFLSVELGYSNQIEGSKTMSCSAEHNIFLINTANKPLTVENDGTYDPQSLSLYTSEKGNFSTDIQTSNSIQSKDGIALIIRKCFENTDGDITVNWKTETVSAESGDTADKNHYVKSEDQCGDILYGDSGQIVYKIGKEYELNERCTWIIRSKRLATITVQLMADGFESCCDGIQVNRIDPLTGVIDLDEIPITRENRFQTLDATDLLITFLSDHSVKGTGFVLEFQTKGKEINSAEVVMKHRHAALESRPTPNNPFGPIFIEKSDNMLSVDTFALQQVEIGNANISVKLNANNLETSVCAKDSVTLYHMPTFRKYEILKRIPKMDLCKVENVLKTGTIPAILIPEPETIYPKSVLVAVTKILQDGADKAVSLTFE